MDPRARLLHDLQHTRSIILTRRLRRTLIFSVASLTGRWKKLPQINADENDWNTKDAKEAKGTKGASSPAADGAR